MDDAFIRPVPEILKHFQVSESKGLSAKAVEAQRQKFGPNGELFRYKPPKPAVY
jgi:hypothetical protein